MNENGNETSRHTHKITTPKQTKSRNIPIGEVLLTPIVCMIPEEADEEISEGS